MGFWCAISPRIRSMAAPLEIPTGRTSTDLPPWAPAAHPRDKEGTQEHPQDDLNAQLWLFEGMHQDYRSNASVCPLPCDRAECVTMRLG